MGSSRCKKYCGCEQGYILDENKDECVRADIQCADDKCSIYGKETIWCRGGSEKCTRTCTNQRIDYDRYCVKGDRKCEPHCTCLKGEVWDKITEECVSNKVCPKSTIKSCKGEKSESITCKGTGNACERECGASGKIKETDCDPNKDRYCESYCVCPNNKYYDPIKRKCLRECESGNIR